MAVGVGGSTVVVGDGGFMGLEWVIVGSWFCGWIDFGMGYSGFIVAKFFFFFPLAGYFFLVCG